MRIFMAVTADRYKLSVLWEERLRGLDLYFEDHGAALAFGVRECEVWTA